MTLNIVNLKLVASTKFYHTVFILNFIKCLFLRRMMLFIAIKTKNIVCINVLEFLSTLCIDLNLLKQHFLSYTFNKTHIIIFLSLKCLC
jgi:hypothetical protein